MSVLSFFSMKKGIYCTKDYYCTVTISFHQHVWHRRPSMSSIFQAAAYLLLCCLSNRSKDSGVLQTSIDYTCVPYKDPDPI